MLSFQCILEAIFSVKKKGYHKILTICGIQVKFRIKNLYFANQRQVAIQDSYDLTTLRKAKKVVVFLIPRKEEVNGGIMSIFSLCVNSRKVAGGHCIIATSPGGMTYARNGLFENDEKIFRWEQLVNNGDAVKHLIVHIPEFYAEKFYSDLTKRDRKFLSAIPTLHINILNQNIELMPKPYLLNSLFRLTPTITQTAAHNRYATQKNCDYWGIPTHLFSVWYNVRRYEWVPFGRKEQIIALSPDKNPYREEIVRALEKGLPGFQIVTIQDLTFDEYMDLVGKAFATITFGEGMDGYLLQPPSVGSVSFAVYNAKFFPNKSWAELDNIYSSYDEMLKNIVQDLQRLRVSEDQYNKIVACVRQNTQKIYSYEGHLKKLAQFYAGEYDFLPRL